MSRYNLKAKSHLVPLCIGVAKPHLGINPVVLGVLRGPYGVGVTGLLVQLDSNRYQVSVVPDVEQTHGGRGVTSLYIRVILAIMWNVFQDIVVHDVNTTGLEEITF